MPFSGEDGGGLLVYALGALSRALDAIKAAALSMFEDTLGLVMGLLLTVGFRGSGGGALSGSELSHLPRLLVDGRNLAQATHIGTDVRPHSECECVCECLTILDSLRSRDPSLVYNGVVAMVNA